MESYLTPRPPEIPEVSSAPYYAKLRELPWREAEPLIRSEPLMWIEETQAGRIYIKVFSDSDERRVTTQVPRGVDLAGLVAKAKAQETTLSIKHIRYQQLPWPEAVAFNRVFLTTTRNVESLAVQPSHGALATLIRGKGFNVVVE